MFSIVLQLFMCSEVTLADLDKSNKSLIESLYNMSVRFPIDGLNMMLLHSDKVISYTLLVEQYDKLVLHLIMSHFVVRVRIGLLPGSSLYLLDPKVTVEHVIGNKLEECKRKINEEIFDFYCMALSRKIIIEKKPKGALEASGRAPFSEGYFGCFETKFDLLSLYRFPQKATGDSSALDCSSWCVDVSPYAGINSVGDCFCFTDMSKLVTIKLSLCRFGTSPFYFAGSQKKYFAIYKTGFQNVRSERSSNPLRHECMQDMKECDACSPGKVGYNCEFVDCSAANGNCAKECSEFELLGYTFGLCRCPEGYFGNAINCQEYDECQHADACAEHQNCANTIGSYDCDCIAGYEKENSGNCIDVDECEDRTRCDLNSTECVNTPGSFRCACLHGFRSIKWFQCADEDECEPPAKMCPDGVPCINLIGSYDCLCPEGTKMFKSFHLTECQDIDECEAPDKCDAKTSFCINIQPFYQCSCRPGYVSVDNFTCVKHLNWSEDEWTTEHPGHEMDRFHVWLALIALFMLILLLICCSKKRASFLTSQRD